jgi:type II secretory pathway pseudopilin PulG
VKRHRQLGISGVIVLALMVLVMVGLIAAYALSRLSTSGDDRAQTASRLTAAADALERYAASALRLPCPADPAANTGNEVQAGAATCTFPDGTLPWNTLGLLREQGTDAWGRKISYRVYTGNKGSLTQPRGVSMVECDTVEPASEGPTPVAGSLGGLCRPDPPDPVNLGLRTTTPTEFLAGKGLALSDSGTAFNDVAYVVISHGSTGLGGYTSSGVHVQIDGKTAPAGDELGNTRDTGAFTIRAFSDAETAATAGTHFDDVLVYRRLPELIERIKLGARNWLPDPVPSNVNVLFDNPTVAAAVGRAVNSAGDNLGASTIDFGSANVSASNSGGAVNVSFATAGGVTGIGAVGGLAGNRISNLDGDALRVDFDTKKRKLGATLGDFGTYTFFLTTYTEQVEFTFYRSGSVVGSPMQKAGCRADGGLASFELDPGADFDRVDIRPVAATPGGVASTSFLLAEFVGCTTAASSCTTTLATPAPAGNTCS